MITNTQPWMEQAKCKGTDDPSFFPPDPDGMPNGVHLRLVAEHELTAKVRFCLGCPVRSACAELGWDEGDGVYGGLSAGERRKMDRGERVGRSSRYIRPINPVRDDVVQMVIEGHDFEAVAEAMSIKRTAVNGMLREHLSLVTQSN